MKLSCALVACNENEHYIAFWPVVKKAWLEIVGIPCILVYIGNDLPDFLKNDPAVILFKPIPDWPTATQAQCIRLLFPALINSPDAIILSDMDIIPLQRDFFVNTILPNTDDQFVSYREPLDLQLVMCYVAATPKTWSSVFNIKTLDDIYSQLKKWSYEYPSDGRHGGTGWSTDQLELHKRVSSWKGNVAIHPGGHPCPRPDRLDRCLPQEWYMLGETTVRRLKNKELVDFHMPPYNLYKEKIWNVIRVLGILESK